MSEIKPEDRKLMAEIREEDPEAYQRLRDKAQWEQMSLYAVLEGWGDPRGWE
jgi:hypothetical protein